MPLIAIEKLTLTLSNVPILRDISLEIGEEKFGLIGESGSGKSMLAKTLLGVLPATATIRTKKLCWQGQDLTRFNKSEWRKIRGSEIAMILQEAKSSLNPLMRIGTQLQEIAGNRSPLSSLQEVHLPEPERILKLYPHQLSGGMAQRVMIAMMLLQQPKLLIADEIVSALDTPMQHEILNLLKDRIASHHMALLYISHDLQQACHLCDRIGIMKEGELLAVGTPKEIREHPHPYVQRLFNALLPEPSL